MTSGYTRLEAALAHREPDSVPFDLGGTIVSGINVKALKNLVTFLGLPVEVKVRGYQLPGNGPARFPAWRIFNVPARELLNRESGARPPPARLLRWGTGEVTRGA